MKQIIKKTLALVLSACMISVSTYDVIVVQIYCRVKDTTHTFVFCVTGLDKQLDVGAQLWDCV